LNKAWFLNVITIGIFISQSIHIILQAWKISRLPEMPPDVMGHIRSLLNKVVSIGSWGAEHSQGKITVIINNGLPAILFCDLWRIAVFIGPGFHEAVFP